MCCRRRYDDGALYTSRRCCRRRGPIRAVITAIVTAVEEKKQERAIAKQITPEITESQSSLKERYPPAVLGREVARTSRSEQGRSNSAPPPEYSDEKSQAYVDQQRRGYEYQAPPPMYEKVEERL